MPLSKDFKEQLSDHLQDLNEEQRKVFLAELDSQMDEAVESAHRAAVAHRSPAELQAAYQLEVSKARRGSEQAHQIRAKYRRLGLNV